MPVLVCSDLALIVCRLALDCALGSQEGAEHECALLVKQIASPLTELLQTILFQVKKVVGRAPHNRTPPFLERQACRTSCCSKRWHACRAMRQPYQGSRLMTCKGSLLADFFGD